MGIKLLAIVLSFEGTFTFPTVKQRAIGEEFFGIFPIRSTKFVWNPAFSFEVDKYWLEFLNPRTKRVISFRERKLISFKGYRGVFPIINTNTVTLCGMIFLSEELITGGELDELNQRKWREVEELYEHNRIEIGLSKKEIEEVFHFLDSEIKIKQEELSIKEIEKVLLKKEEVLWGLGIFIDRKDWWKIPPWQEGWDYEIGIKGGIGIEGNSVSIIITKDNKKEKIEVREYIFYKWRNYGISSLIERDEIKFVGGYHTTNLKGGKFIKGIKVVPNRESIRYSLLLGGEGEVGKILTLYGGYVVEGYKLPYWSVEKEEINLGVEYQVSKLRIILNMGTPYFYTPNWEVCISYGY
jgi:hypothetical protein